MQNDKTIVQADVLRDYCSRLFSAVGVPSQEAEVNADNLVDADLKGVESHGVSRMGIYLKRLRMGLVRAEAKLDTISERPGTALYDACNSMGAVVSQQVMAKVIEKARYTGIAFATVRNSNHYSTAAYFAEMALKHNMIGFTASNGPSRMAPWGGTEPAFGTSPFAFAIPAGEQLPIIADMASCVVARGKIILAAKRGEPIPLGWARNKAGEDTTNAQDALEGTVLPFGGPKGSAIATIIESMTGILAGSVFTTDIKDLYADFANSTRTSHYFGAIDIEAFQPFAEYAEIMDRFILSIKSNTKASGVQEIFLPGEMELKMRQRRSVEGIPLSRLTLDELMGEGISSGVTYTLE